MGLGTPELIIIFIVALVVFGPRKLPELGRSLGRSLSEFKRASNELRATLDDEIRLEEHRAANASPAPAVPSQVAVSSDVAASSGEASPVEGDPEVVARGAAHS